MEDIIMDGDLVQEPTIDGDTATEVTIDGDITWKWTFYIFERGDSSFKRSVNINLPSGFTTDFIDGELHIRSNKNTGDGDLVCTEKWGVAGTEAALYLDQQRVDGFGTDAGFGINGQEIHYGGEYGMGEHTVDIDYTGTQSIYFESYDPDVDWRWIIRRWNTQER